MVRRSVVVVVSAVSAVAALVSPTSPFTAPAAAGTSARQRAVNAAAAYARTRGFHMGVAVLDTATGQFYGAGDYTGTFATESVVKAFIATRLLVSGQMHGTTESMAWKMITQSDDAMASALYGRVGGDGLIDWVKRHYHVPGLGSRPRLPGWWGNTHITARGLVTFYARIKRSSVVRPWLLNAMHHATKYGSDGTYQFFGLPSATSGAAVKQGWGCDYDDYCSLWSDFNSTGFVDGDRYAVALLCRGPLHDYGTPIASVLTGAARALLPGGSFPANPPVISYKSGTTGPLTGRTVVTLHGKDFVAVRRVLFGTVPAASFTVVSPTEIRATSPAHDRGIVNIRVVTAAGTSPVGTHSAFEYVPPPWIHSAQPNEVAAAGGTTVTITGYNFRAVRSVKLGTDPAESFRVVSPREITATLPAHAAGPARLWIRSAYGRSTPRPAGTVQVVGIPAVQLLSRHSSGVAGGGDVVISGAEFRQVQQVLFGDVASPQVSVQSPGQLTAAVPAHPAGTVDVRVVTAFGTSPVEEADQFAYEAAPQITTTDVPDATVGAAYSAALHTAGSGPGTWAVESGALPDGLALSAGHITGTPVTAGTARFTVRVTDSWGQTASRTLSVTVAP